MADILSRCTALKVKPAQDGEQVDPGTACIAPLPTGICWSTPTGPYRYRNRSWWLFESAACFKERAIAVVLSGIGSDGSMGVKAIKKMGGTVIVQDEKSAEFFGM